MKTKEVMRRICAIIVIVAMVGYYCGDGLNVKANTEVTTSILPEEDEFSNLESQSEETLESDGANQTSNEGETKNYIVQTKSKEGLSKIKNQYSESDEINENTQGLLEEEKAISVELSDSAIHTLAEDDNVVYIEEDAVVEASGNASKEKKTHIKNKKPHKIKKNTLKKNSSSTEWNVRMIKADKNKAENAERIKIAILDSGIDWGNDINLAYQVSLVPGEEEMTQMFMDGTGHGSSVASLIAANDDGNGITGINNNVDIYSYRVLDDEDQAPVSRVAEAIYMAIEQDVNIINMSFGMDDYSEILKEAIHAAKEKGILIIAAAGNTGDDGVQYPAAYEDVMAVGAVNKDGMVEHYSAKGEEIEVVAPGELVRTTGFIGTEEVISGTSLAAPQVTAVATLIWQKDPKVSADFVRGLLDESANLYGETDEYGNGLVDAEYALNYYDEYKQKYNESEDKTKQLLPLNESEITTFDDTGCVQGSWKADDHESMIKDSSRFCVRAGARFPDVKGVKNFTYNGTSYTLDMGNDNGKDTRKFAGMTKNPWWHGYYTTNYIMAAIYATRMADAIKTYGKYNKASNSFGYNDANSMQESIKYLYDDSETGWKYALTYMKNKNENNADAQNQKNTDGFKRAFVWGMAIHTATDAYAHSTRNASGDIKHVGGEKDADNKDYSEYRFTEALYIARKIMDKYTSNGSLTAKDLEVYGDYTIGFELKEYDKYIHEVDPSIPSYSFSLSSK